MNSSAAELERSGEQQNPKDCLSCRIIGTGTLGGVGIYALWQTRVAAPGTPLQKKGLAIVGLGEIYLPGVNHLLKTLCVALVAGGVLRWNKCRLGSAMSILYWYQLTRR